MTKVLFNTYKDLTIIKMSLSVNFPKVCGPRNQT